MQPGLALIGEIDVAVAREHQIVDALEPLRPSAVDDGRDGSGFGIEFHQPVAIVGDDDATVAGDRQAVGFAVIFGDERELARGVDAEDAAVRNGARQL